MPKILVNKERLKSTVKVRNKGTISVIVPLQNENTWIKGGLERFMTLIDSTGETITESVTLDSDICDAKEYGNGLLVTCYNRCKVIKLAGDGKSKATFSDLSPFNTLGLCVTHNMEVVVCLQSTEDKEYNWVTMLNREGDPTQNIQYGITGSPLYNDLYRVTSLPTGEIIVVDGGRVVAVNRKGKHLFTWEGEIHGKKIDNYRACCITHDSNNNLFVTDYRFNRVHVLEKDGTGAMCLVDKAQGMMELPHGIAFDRKGQLWVGCFGKIQIRNM